MPSRNDGRSSGGSEGPEVRRPLLGGGERLKEVVPSVPAGGPKWHPGTLNDAHALLAPQAGALAEAVEALPQDLQGPHVVIEATLLPNYLAASYFPTALLDSHGLYPVGTRQASGTLKTRKRETEDSPTKTLLLAGEPERVLKFAAAAMKKPQDERDPVWGQLREFSELRLPVSEAVVRNPRVPLGAGEVITWEAVLNPIGRDEDERSRFGAEVFRRWTSLVWKLHGEIDQAYRREVGGVVFVPIALNGEAIREAARFNLVRALRPMPQVRPYRPSFRREAIKSPLPPVPEGDSRPLTAERVAIFDGGIDVLNPFMKPYVTLTHLTTEPADDQDLEHGSMVTSAFLYGHVERGQQTLPSPLAHVDHFRVLPPPAATTVDHRLYQLFDLIKAKVEEKKYRYVNLSLGPDEVVDDGEPHYWTAGLDELAAEHGVTFFLAAGNNGDEDHSLGFDRVQVPGDMVNGLAVGSASTPRGKKTVRASYSAIGPGRSGQRVQPIGVAFGGDDPAPFGGIDHRGRHAESSGTSYAAPFAMRAAVQLGANLGSSRATTSAIRSFSTHFAERARRGHDSIQLGFGRLPSSYDTIFSCQPNEVTVVYQDSLARAEVVGMRLPVPSQGLGDVAVEIEWTYSFVSRVNPADAADYTLSGIEETFRPHDRIRSASRRDPTTQSTESKEVDLGQISLAILQAQGWNVSVVPKAHSQRLKAGCESGRRAAGKWETIVRGRVRLASGELYLPRLDLKHISRDGGVLTREVPPLDLSLVVSIRAPVGVSIYDLVRQQFRVLTPIVTTLPITVEARA